MARDNLRNQIRIPTTTRRHPSSARTRLTRLRRTSTRSKLLAMTNRAPQPACRPCSSRSPLPSSPSLSRSTRTRAQLPSLRRTITGRLLYLVTTPKIHQTRCRFRAALTHSKWLSLVTLWASRICLKCFRLLLRSTTLRLSRLKQRKVGSMRS